MYKSMITRKNYHNDKMSNFFAFLIEFETKPYGMNYLVFVVLNLLYYQMIAHASAGINTLHTNDKMLKC